MFDLPSTNNPLEERLVSLVQMDPSLTLDLMTAWLRIVGPPGSSVSHELNRLDSTADLEIKSISSFCKAHSDIRPLSTFTLDSQYEISRTVENRLDLRPRCHVINLSKQLSCRCILFVGELLSCFVTTSECRSWPSTDL